MAERLCDVAVIGAGPAGLSAAVQLGEAGLQVKVLDEYPVPGGRLLGQSHRLHGRWFVGRQVANGLVAQAVHAGAELRCNTSVWGLRQANGIWRVDASGGETVFARACLTATGATEVPVPTPGWHLPGVIGVGAAQVLANVWGVAPGRRGVVVGTSPLAFAIAQELRWAGVELTGIVMPPAYAGTAHLGDVPAQWSRLGALSGLAPAWARPGARLMRHPAWQRRLVPLFPVAGLPVAGTRLRLGVAAESILGEHEVEGIRLRRLGGDGQPVGESFDERVDFVCLAGGLRPVPDLLAATCAEMVSLRGLGGEVPVVAPDFATTAPGLFAAGNAVGVEGAAVAMAQGRLAALGVLRWLRGEGAVAPPALDRARAAVQEARTAAPIEFQPGVDEAWRTMEQLWHGRKGA